MQHILRLSSRRVLRASARRHETAGEVSNVREQGAAVVFSRAAQQFIGKDSGRPIARPRTTLARPYWPRLPRLRLLPNLGRRQIVRGWLLRAAAV